VGAVAFRRTGDQTSGDFSDAKVIRKFGEVTNDLLLIGLYSGKAQRFSATTRAQKAETTESEYHHRPSCWFWSAGQNALERIIMELSLAAEIFGVEKAVHLRTVRHRRVLCEHRTVPGLEAETGCVGEIPDDVRIEIGVAIEVLARALGEIAGHIDNDRLRGLVAERDTVITPGELCRR
jgi:hypothetical protein